MGLMAAARRSAAAGGGGGGGRRRRKGRRVWMREGSGCGLVCMGGGERD
uniref:Uncharacterized protein n=1 Tax=Arundo donax TaxID=35708 RepID=A0A0A9F9H5_ARUDO